MMNKKVASIAISASLVAGGVSIPVTLVYGQTLPKTTIEYSGKYDITDGEQALNQNTQNKLFNINVKYIYNNKVVKNETQKVNYNGSVNGSTISSLNWMYMGGYNEWTISRHSGDASSVFGVDASGSVSRLYVSISYVVRPSFNLESSVTYVSGDGTASSPIRIG